MKRKPQYPVKGLNAHKGKRFTGRLLFFQAKEMGINCLYRKQIQRGVPVPAHLINQRHPPTPSHSRGSWEGIKLRNYAWDWLLASAPWRWLSRVNVRTLHCLSHWQNNSLNVCRFHTALSRHNDAQAKFARPHNCPLIVSQKRH